MTTMHNSEVYASLPDPSAAKMPERYHNGNTKPGGKRGKKPPMLEREVIAWDMEGMNLSGDNKPQHAVVFGSSVSSLEPLIGQRLTTMEMLNYVIQVGESFPNAIHVGYGFKYDANMIIQGLSEHFIDVLWKSNHVRFRLNGYTWSIHWIPGKIFDVTRRPLQRKGHDGGRGTTVRIYDYSSFFGGSAFLKACEEILRDDLSASDRDVIARGKADRGNHNWDGIEEVLHYWRLEIQLIRRTFERFRDVMYRAGFELKDWYGPGALANYINSVHKIRPHLAGAQTTSTFMPDAVHEASKVAFSGGRFELFQGGRTTGPIYAIDINSAYPYALTMVPSLDPNYGEWVHVDNPDTTVRFGVYRITFRAPNASPFEYRPMPLFYRDVNGLISYPNMVTGWYWSPEARMVMGQPGVTVHEGWEWRTRTEVFPWEFLRDMYATRKRLGKDNLLSMPFKLGPNSLYGKYAQTVGWDQKKSLPPRSHALPVAGWVTSFCRSMLWSVIRQIPKDVIAVETDSVFTTVDPRTLNLTIGDELGEWGFTEYDELMYVQSGMYHTKTGGEWRGVRSRGLSRAEYPPETAAGYLASLRPGEEWHAMSLRTKPKFIGAGAALQSEAPFKAIHCAWKAQEREVAFGNAGKRRHIASTCPACKEGYTPFERPHRLAVHSISDGRIPSFPRVLPWEKEVTPEVVELIRNAEEIQADHFAVL